MRYKGIMFSREPRGKRQIVWLDGLGHQQWLVWDATIIAVFSEEVYFPDLEHTRAEMAAINGFHPHAPHVRVPATDFDYYVASSAMRGLRPLLGRPAEPTSGEPQ